MGVAHRPKCLIRLIGRIRPISLIENNKDYLVGAMENAIATPGLMVLLTVMLRR